MLSDAQTITGVSLFITLGACRRVVLMFHVKHSQEDPVEPSGSRVE